MVLLKVLTMSKSRGRQPVFLSGKLKYLTHHCFYLINDEHLSFKELIEDEGFEFEIIGNIWEDGELLDVENEVSS